MSAAVEHGKVFMAIENIENQLDYIHNRQVILDAEFRSIADSNLQPIRQYLSWLKTAVRYSLEKQVHAEAK